MAGLLRAFVLWCGVLACGAASAQPTLDFMIPANPGGGWDQTGRALAAAMQSAKLVSGAPFENKGSAGGTDHILAWFLHGQCATRREAMPTRWLAIRAAATALLSGRGHARKRGEAAPQRGRCGAVPRGTAWASAGGTRSRSDAASSDGNAARTVDVADGRA